MRLCPSVDGRSARAQSREPAPAIWARRSEARPIDAAARATQIIVDDLYRCPTELPGTLNQPTRLAHLDDGNDCAILVQGDEGPAQVVRLGHRGTPSVRHSDDVPISSPPAP